MYMYLNNNRKFNETLSITVKSRLHLIVSTV